MDLTEMIAALEQALALSPDNAPLRLQLAALCMNADRWSDAEMHYKQVLITTRRTKRPNSAWPGCSSVPTA